MKPRAAIIIPNWNGWRDTVECLDSIWKMDYDDHWAVVVDNGSTDGSISEILEHCKRYEEGRVGVLNLDRETALAATPDEVPLELSSQPNRLVLIRNENNLGFAEGSNIGMSFALNALRSKYLMLLNNDTVVDPALLNELVGSAEYDKSIGLLGPKTYYYSYEGRKDIILYAGGRIVPWREIVYKHIGAGEPDEGQYDKDGETEWCTGGGMMIRAELARTRLLNADYPFGNEDAEYSIKAMKDGWKVVYVHKAVMWHKVGVSRAKTGKRIRRGIYWYFRFIRSNFSLPWYLYHVFLFTVVMLPKWFFMYIALPRDRHALRGFLSEIRRFAR